MTASHDNELEVPKVDLVNVKLGGSIRSWS
jgi:hypothetical protein